MYERNAPRNRAAGVLRPSDGVFAPAVEAGATERSAARHAGRIAPGLKRFAAVQAALVGACFGAEWFAGRVLHLNGAYVYPLRTPNQTCWDFTLFANKFQHFGRPEFFAVDPGIPFSYPAPAAVVYHLFFSYRAHPLGLFLAFMLAAFLVAGVGLGFALHRRGMAAANAAGFLGLSLAAAYPLWFDAKQGNIEICVWVLVALGVWAFCKGRGYGAAACFGIAGAMKIFPLIYLGLLLARRRYRETGFAIAVAGAVSVGSLWLLGPGIANAWRSLQASLDSFRTVYVLHFRPEEIGFDHSLFGVYKRFHHPLPPPERLGAAVTIYLAAAAVCGTALYFGRIRKLPAINQVLCLSVASILLPPISFDYTLMYLYLPWAMLVLLTQEQWQRRQRQAWPEPRGGRGSGARLGLTVEWGQGLAFLCLAVLVSPESELIHNEVHFGGQFKALVLAVLFGVGLTFRFALGEEFGSAGMEGRETVQPAARTKAEAA